MSIHIRPAIPDDVPGVLRIAADHDLPGKSAERARAEGFLVSAYPAELYLRCLRSLSVAEIDGGIAGFTLTFRRAELPPEVKNGERIQRIAGDADYFLIKQVGVSPFFQKRGIGKALYLHHLETLTIPAFAPIVLNPKNIVSIAFHEALHFSQVETSYDEAGQPANGLWCRRPPEA